MSAETPALTRSFPVGRRYECTITIPQQVRGQVRITLVEWSPAIPKRLSKAEMRQYRAGRDSAFAELAERTGMTSMLVEI